MYSCKVHQESQIFMVVVRVIATVAVVRFSSGDGYTIGKSSKIVTVRVLVISLLAIA